MKCCHTSNRLKIQKLRRIHITHRIAGDTSGIDFFYRQSRTRQLCWLPGSLHAALTLLRDRWQHEPDSEPNPRDGFDGFDGFAHGACRFLFYGISEDECEKSGLMNLFTEQRCPETMPRFFPARTPLSQLVTVLGGCFDVLVFNAWAGFHPDRFAVLSGAIAGGGCIVLITPEAEQWPAYADPEREHLISCVADAMESDLSDSATKKAMLSPYLHRMVKRLCEGVRAEQVMRGDVPPLKWAHFPIRENAFSSASARTPQPTRDQGRVIADLLKRTVAFGHLGEPKRQDHFSDVVLPPLGLILGARGRGKSLVLAWFIEAILRDSSVTSRVVHLVAPHAEAIASIRGYFLGQGGLPDKKHLWDQIRHWDTQSALSALPLTVSDNASTARKDVLLIEEAATVPFSQLQHFVNFPGSLIVASTTQGYEGSGRVLGTRLQAWSKALKRETVLYTLTEPLRWASNDPAEACINDVLLMDDVKLMDEMKIQIICDVPTKNPCTRSQLPLKTRIRWYTQYDLAAENEDQLAAIWSLLYGAHYRSRPSDLRAMLDQPDVFIAAAYQGTRCVGAAWLVLEGPFAAPLQAAMLNNKRRPRGHVLPQILALRLGCEEALGWCHVRCVRIAVDPDVRQQGIGRDLLQQVVTNFQDEKWRHQNHLAGKTIVGIGASFALHDDILTFWRHCGFEPIRYGVALNARSGTSSVTVYHGFTPAMCAHLAAQRRVLNVQMPGIQRVFLNKQEAGKKQEHHQKQNAQTEALLASETQRLMDLYRFEKSTLLARFRAFARGTASESDVTGLLPIIAGDHAFWHAEKASQEKKNRNEPSWEAQDIAWLKASFQANRNWHELWYALQKNGLKHSRKKAQAIMRYVVACYLKAEERK